MSFLAFFDLVLTLTGAPGVPGAGKWLMDLSAALHIIIWLCFCGICMIRLKYMWKARSMWFEGAREPPWVLMQAIVLCC